MAVELLDQTTGQCFYSLGGPTTYAKFVVDSVNASRRLFLRTVVRPELRLPLARSGFDPHVLMHDVKLVRERLDDLREAMRRREALDALGASSTAWRRSTASAAR